MMTRRIALGLTATLLIAGLGACSKSEDPAARGANYTDTRENPVDDMAPPAPEPSAPDSGPIERPTPAGESNGSAVLSEKAPAAAPDEQLQDDASATGMTTRASRSEQTNETAPAETN